MNKTRRIQTLDGLPVYDATEPLWIEVIKEDVKPNRRKDPERCALAAACTRSLHVEARAYLSRMYIRHDDHWLRYQLPETVRQEVASFDRGGGFSEGTYRLPPLPPAKRSGGAFQGGKTSKLGRDRNTEQKRPSHRVVHGVRSNSPLMGGAIEHKPTKPTKE